METIDIIRHVTCLVSIIILAFVLDRMEYGDENAKRREERKRMKRQREADVRRRRTASANREAAMKFKV